MDIKLYWEREAVGAVICVFPSLGFYENITKRCWEALYLSPLSAAASEWSAAALLQRRIDTRQQEKSIKLTIQTFYMQYLLSLLALCIKGCGVSAAVEEGRWSSSSSEELCNIFFLFLNVAEFSWNICTAVIWGLMHIWGASDIVATPESLVMFKWWQYTMGGLLYCGDPCWVIKVLHGATRFKKGWREDM